MRHGPFARLAQQARCQESLADLCGQGCRGEGIDRSRNRSAREGEGRELLEVTVIASGRQSAFPAISEPVSQGRRQKLVVDGRRRRIFSAGKGEAVDGSLIDEGVGQPRILLLLDPCDLSAEGQAGIGAEVQAKGRIDGVATAVQGPDGAVGRLIEPRKPKSRAIVRQGQVEVPVEAAGVETSGPEAQFKASGLARVARNQIDQPRQRRAGSAAIECACRPLGHLNPLDIDQGTRLDGPARQAVSWQTIDIVRGLKSTDLGRLENDLGNRRRRDP